MFSAKQQRVLVLYAGGVQFTEPFSAKRATTLLTEYLDLQFMAEADLIILNQVEPVAVTWSLASSIGQAIIKHYQNYDGFVVLHDCSAALYIANLLSHLLKNLGKPIIFTGTVLPKPTQLEKNKPVANEMQLRTNLITGIQLATLNCSGVFLAYGTIIVRATSAIDAKSFSIEPFVSWPELPVAQIQFNVNLLSVVSKRTKQVPQLYPKFVEAVQVITLLPTQPVINVASNVKALVLTGLINPATLTHLTLPTNIPVILCTKNYSGKLPNNIIIAQQLTLISTITKIMVGLGVTTTLADFKQWLQKEL
ncbi:MAG: asparaginase domain-containing protein [Patescibacteria group bacterium]|jgi:L-asparaginase/Glu-tRNA(Gln) amidotransferase subunit D